MAQDGEVNIHADFEQQILQAIAPQMSDLAEAVNTHLDASAPRDTGTLAEAVHADFNPATGLIDVGVEDGHINPRTGQEASEYAKYVIHGTSREHANDFVGRAVDAALQEIRAKGNA